MRQCRLRAMIAAAGANRGAGTYDVEAPLLDREGRRDEARGAYTKAAALNSGSFYIAAEELIAFLTRQPQIWSSRPLSMHPSKLKNSLGTLGAVLLMMRVGRAH